MNNAGGTRQQTQTVHSKMFLITAAKQPLLPQK